uniref:Uncharacterized protein n=1 Tax=Lepeophtheirus salmonis TaxID=72036 RepID=A0A0K2TJM9_LEPSM
MKYINPGKMRFRERNTFPDPPDRLVADLVHVHDVGVTGAD